MFIIRKINDKFRGPSPTNELPASEVDSRQVEDTSLNHNYDNFAFTHSVDSDEQKSDEPTSPKFNHISPVQAGKQSPQQDSSYGNTISNASTPNSNYMQDVEIVANSNDVPDKSEETSNAQNQTQQTHGLNRNPHHGHNSFYEKQRLLQESQQGVASNRDSIASAAVDDTDDDNEDFGGEIIEKSADQLFSAGEPALTTHTNSYSGAQSDSFYTQQSMESTGQSRASMASNNSSTQNLNFEQWKEVHMSRVNMVALEGLLFKQKERYGENMFEALVASDQVDVDKLRREQGFSFEESVLYRFNSVRGLKLPVAGKFNTPRQPESNGQQTDANLLTPYGQQPHAQQHVSPMSTQSTVSTQSLPYMRAGVAIPEGEPSLSTAFYLHAQEKYIEGLGEDGQVRLSLMLSEQEEKCGKNMFDAMVPMDHQTLHKLIQQGALFEDAMFQIYKLKYPMYMGVNSPTSTSQSAFSFANTSMNGGNVNTFTGYSDPSMNMMNMVPNQMSSMNMMMPNVTGSMMYPNMVTQQPTMGMAPYLDPSTGMIVMVPTPMMTQAAPMMMMGMPQTPMMMTTGPGMMTQPYYHDTYHHSHSKKGSFRHHDKELSRPPSQRQSLSRQGSHKSEHSKHAHHSSHTHSVDNSPTRHHRKHHSDDHHLHHGSGSNHNMHLVSHSGSFHQLPIYPSGSHPPSRIPSRQSMMTRSNSSSSQVPSRVTSLSRSNSGAGVDANNNHSRQSANHSHGKTPSLEPSRQESPTRRQIERR